MAPPTAPSKFTKPRLLWKTFLRRCDSTPVALASAVYTGAGSYLYQLDSGGRTLWATETGSQQSSPALDETRVYIGSDRGVLYAVDRRTGQVAWRFTAGNTLLTPPAVGGGRVYAESTDNNVYAVDARKGALRWKFARPDGSLGYSGPVYTRDSLFVGGESTLYSLDPATGKERWRAAAGGKSLSTPAVGGRRVFAGGDGSGLSAFSEAGKPLWSFPGKAGGDWFGPPLYAAGTVYVTTYQRYVYAVDALTGKAKWSARVSGSALAAPALDTGRSVLYVTAQTFRKNPTLWAFAARTGTELWSYPAGSINKSAAVRGDRLYVGSLDGYFYAFSL
jgi:outer membrane protein assembly factor BamB